MKKLIFTSIFVILFSNLVFAQSKSIETIQSQINALKATKYISIEYDKSSNFAKLLLFCDGFGNDQNKKNGLSSFAFGMKHDFIGSQLSKPPEVFILTFWAKGKNTQFSESHTWRAKVDGESLEIDEGRYAKKSGDDREFLNFVLSREKLEKISQGKQVSFQIGKVDFNLSVELLQTFANYLKISNPNL